MGRRGPAPKPTQMKIREGTYRRDRAASNEPKPMVKVPPCPAHLGPEARKEWRRMGRELVALGVMTTVDRAALAAYCVSYARWVEAETQVKRLGIIVKTSNGNLVQNPYLAVANRAMKDMTRLAAEFGMTPSSRSRVQTQSTDDELSLAELLFGDAVAGSSTDVAEE